MEKLENILKKGSLAVGAGLLTIATLGFLEGCYASTQYAQKTAGQESDKKIVLDQKGKKAEEGYSGKVAKLKNISEEAIKRGYLTDEEFQYGAGLLVWSEVTPRVSGHIFQKDKDIVSLNADMIDKDLLPFKAMLYLSLEKEKYDTAESVIRDWAGYLNLFKAAYRQVYGNEVSKESRLGRKINSDLEKLSEIGLADPILTNLRRERATALKNKDWDTAQKIQNLIEGRKKEMQPVDKPQEKSKTVPESKTVVIQQSTQQPSEQYLKVEQIPRYGATDMGRAAELLSGKKATDKEWGIMKSIDILLSR